MYAALIVFVISLILFQSIDTHADGPSSPLARTFERLHSDHKAKANRQKRSRSVIVDQEKSGLQLATFGNGCFWCTEAVFEELRGVKEVLSGYSGGRMADPTYKQVCTGLTGHAEVIHLRFDPKEISYGKLLEVFWRTHDPTTKNRQGADVGTQYRSAVFFHNDEQRKLAEHFKAQLNKAKAFREPIVTEITEFKRFYPAENYHQDYFQLNGRAPYCRQMIQPKLAKFRSAFANELDK